ncbi:uncharacterized protein DC041_0004831 [Schistosoma bovis]|uniref:NTR domain-containing protein n=1 Tax=Schistosoma bovis TaxID=6184 RepID=A0A430QCP0_SCHBO|nr:uncharacterized protein DC041_0004831 [Schistosoma bovis]
MLIIFTKHIFDSIDAHIIHRQLKSYYLHEKYYNNSVLFVFVGIYISGVPHVDSCSWKAPWNQVTREQKRYLRNRYSIQCGICQLQRVLFVDPIYHRNPKTCYLPISPNSNEMMCRDKFSLCRLQRRTNRCNFINNKSYRICETWSTKHI